MNSHSDSDTFNSPSGLTGDGQGFSLIMIVATLALVTAKLADSPTLRSANDRSRWCTIWSLAERQTWQIDEIRQQPGWDTIDIVRMDDHFYSTKPPLLPLTVSYLYRGLKAVTGWDLLQQRDACVRVLLFVVNVLPMGLALVLLGGITQRHCEGRFQKRLVMAVACWGTMLLPFLTVLNNHTVAATFLVFALSPALRLLSGECEDWWRYFVCGLCTGIVATQELPALGFAVGLLALLGRHSLGKTITGYAVGTAIPILGSLALNQQVTGDWMPFYADFGSSLYNFVENGVPSYWMQPTGIDRPRDGSLTYLFHCTFGHHGIFSLTPIFLISAASVPLGRAWRESELVSLRWLIPGLSAVVLGFYLTRTQNYNYSGVSVALRWMLWLIPLWIIALIPALNAWSGSRAFRWTSLALLGISVFSAWYPGNSPWAQNWIYVEMERAGWIDYSDPVLQLQHRHQSWIGNLPTGELQPDYWISWSAVSVEGKEEILRLSDGGPRDNHRLLKVLRQVNQQSQFEATYVLDPVKFNEGTTPEEFVVSHAGGEPATAADIDFFRGLQRPATYQSAQVVRYQYLKTNVRTDAFECHPAFAFETHADSTGRDCQFIRDVWFCAEVPFGVLRWEERVVDDKTRAQLGRKLWQLQSLGKTFPRENTQLRP